jgi:hypothetical protein
MVSFLCIGVNIACHPQELTRYFAYDFSIGKNNTCRIKLFIDTDEKQ